MNALFSSFYHLKKGCQQNYDVIWQCHRNFRRPFVWQRQNDYRHRIHIFKPFMTEADIGLRYERVKQIFIIKKNNDLTFISKNTTE